MADELSGFTAGETKLLASMLKNMEGDVTTNFAAVAAECEYKDASVARIRWCQIKKKKKINASAPAGGIDKSSPNKKTAAGPTKATKGADSADDGTEKPKRGRGRPKKNTVKAEEVGVKQDDTDEDGKPLKATEKVTEDDGETEA